MIIDGYSIGGYWCLLMVINGYFIGGYQCLLIGIILVVILLMDIGDYSIISHW
jgi:hypothetical protein